MKITNESGVAVGSLWSSVGGDPTQGEGETPVDCCNPGGDPPPDRAEGSDAVTVNTPSVGGIVQVFSGTWHTGGLAFTEDFATTPVNGDTMYAFLFTEDGTGSVIDTAGWSLLETASAFVGETSLWSKVAGAAEPTTVSVPAAGGGGQTRRLVLYEVGGSHDVSDALSNQGTSSPLTGPTITPGSTTGVLIAAFMARVPTYVGDPTFTPQSPLTTDTFSRNPSARFVAWTGNETTDTNPVTPMVDVSGPSLEADTGSIAVNVDASPTPVVWNVPAPNTVDDDDATYMEIVGSQVLRIDLGGAFRIVSSRLLVGSEDPGLRTYTIKGANAADFSDAVTLATYSFTATGSFTPDDINPVWLTSDLYRYFELDGSTETRRVFTWELYEPDTSQGQDHDHDGLQQQINDLQAAVSVVGGRWELAVIPGSPPDPLYADGDFLYILVT